LTPDRVLTHGLLRVFARYNGAMNRFLLTRPTHGKNFSL
jgi:hypothetical protein